MPAALPDARRPKASPAVAFALLGVAMLLWAGNSIVGRAFRFDIPPFTLAFLRWLLAAIVLAPFAARSFLRDLPVLRQRWPIVVLLGLLGIGGFHSLLYAGLQRTSASNALLVQAAVPMVVLLLDRAIFGARSTGMQKLGVALSTLGVAVVVFAGDFAKLLSLELHPGDLVVLVSVVVWASYTILLRKRPRVSAAGFLFATVLVGAVSVAPLALGEMLSGEQIRWSANLALALAYLCLGPSIAAYVIFNWATDVVGAAASGQATTLLPVFGAALSAAILGEVLHPYHLVGMALIAAGIAFSLVSLRRAGKAAEAQLEPRA